MGCIRTPIWRRSYTLVAMLMGIALFAGVAVLVNSNESSERNFAAGFEARESTVLAAVPSVEPEAPTQSTAAASPSAPIAPAVGSTPDPQTRPTAEQTAPKASPVAVAPEPLGPSLVEGQMRRGETLASSLGKHGVSPSIVHQISRELRGHFDFRRAQPGHRYSLARDAEGELEAFRYMTSNTVSYELVRSTDDDFDAARVEAELTPRRQMIAGIVTSSLYGAITDLGGGAQLANDFSDVFAYDVDFSRTVRPGDEFRILFEDLYRTDENGEEVFVRPGRILAASYGGAGGEHVAVYYESGEGRAGYYRPDGSAVERQFLRAPLRYSRISSRYSEGRRHPILKVTRPHHGIDYAAPHGTPVYAVSPGEVVYRSRAGGFGNLVKVRHEDGYVSYYSHLSRFASGLKKGQRVGQKQVIGYVGSTGLATGPHVCFRVAKNGRYVNPVRLPSPAGPPLPAKHEASFRKHRDVLLAALDSGRLVTVDEAL